MWRHLVGRYADEQHENGNNEVTSVSATPQNSITCYFNEAAGQADNPG